jgi:hypothetical protein
LEPILELETAFAVIAGVLVVSALAAGVVERAPLSFPMLFLGLGFLIGDRGLQVVSIGLDNQVLEVVAVVALQPLTECACAYWLGMPGPWCSWAWLKASSGAVAVMGGGA